MHARVIRCPPGRGRATVNAAVALAALPVHQLAKMLKTVEEKGTYTSEGNKIDNRIILISPTSFSPSNNCFKCLNGLDWEKDVMDDYDETAFKDK